MLLMILVIITTITGCKGNWSVANIDISPEDSLYADFMIITDQDSTKHWYERTTVDNGILVGENYCYRHNNWEVVRKKSE